MYLSLCSPAGVKIGGCLIDRASLEWISTRSCSEKVTGKQHLKYSTFYTEEGRWRPLDCDTADTHTTHTSLTGGIPASQLSTRCWQCILIHERKDKASRFRVTLYGFWKLSNWSWNCDGKMTQTKCIYTEWKLYADICRVQQSRWHAMTKINTNNHVWDIYNNKNVVVNFVYIMIITMIIIDYEWYSNLG